jgi:2-polyprenyl-6-methoxyphenol hydroxylase-like FAD-dependent oxidoreductase
LGAIGVRVGIIGGSIAGCATATLLHRAGHDVIVFERSGSDLVSRGAAIGTPTAVWQDMMARGLIDETFPTSRDDYVRYVTRGTGTGQPRRLGDVHISLAGFNWAHLYQGLRRGVPDELYRGASAVERIEAGPHGTTVHLLRGGSLDFDLVVCADGYRSMGRRLIDPDATLGYRGMVMWRGLLPESDIRVDALDGCNLLRVGYQGGTGSWVGTSSIQAIYSVAPRRYARDSVCLVGDAGAVYPPFTGSGVFKAMANATSLVDALADASAVDDALRRWSEAQLQVVAQVVPVAERTERRHVFEMPDLAAMPPAATNDWMSSAHPGFVITLPDA